VNKHRLKILGVLFGTATCAPAWADSPWYLEGSAGSVFTENNSRATIDHVGGVFAPGTNTTTYSAGPDFAVGVGYKLPHIPHVRLQAEFGYAHYAVDTIAPASAAFPSLNGSQRPAVSGGDRDFFTADAEAFYDLPSYGRFQPYLGGGAGYYHVSAGDVHTTTSFGAPFTGHTGNFDGPILLAEGGVNIRIDDRWSVVPAYRYQHLFATAGRTTSNHILKIGLRFDL
jgi:opacity protein-like surface antigen